VRSCVNAMRHSTSPCHKELAEAVVVALDRRVGPGAQPRDHVGQRRCEAGRLLEERAFVTLSPVVDDLVGLIALHRKTRA